MGKAEGRVGIMQALERVETSTGAKPKGRRATRYVPAMPTLWPSMIVRAPGGQPPFPFGASRVRAYSFSTNAIWAAARLLGLEGAEVLAPSYHDGVEVEALLAAGASVRFYRVGSRMDVDPSEVERRIGPRTRALYLIHYLGFPGPAEAFFEICSRRGLLLIEDCALGLLSADGEKPLGLTGHASIFSLRQSLPVPNGGLLVFNHGSPRGMETGVAPPLASTASHVASALLANLELRLGMPGAAVRGALRAAGRTVASALGIDPAPPDAAHFDPSSSRLGMSRLTQRIALGQSFSSIVARRRRNYFLLLGQLRELAPAVFGELPAGVCPLFFPLLVRDKGAVKERLEAAGIETIDFWRHRHPACSAEEFPEAEELRRWVLEVPVHQDLGPQAMADMASRIRQVLQEEETRGR